MAIKFLSDIDVTGSYNLQASDIPDISATYATVAWVTNQNFLTTLPAHNHDDRYYTKSQSDNKYLLIGGETDPVFVAHPAYGVTAQKITNWDSAFGWGDHRGPGYLLKPEADGYYQPIGNYDNYSSWNLKTNSVQRTTVTSGGTLNLVAGTNVTVGYSAGGTVTISSSVPSEYLTQTEGDARYLQALPAHTHPIEEVDGLQDILDTKADAGHTHSYLPLAGGTLTSGLSIDTTGTALSITGNTTVDSSDVSIYLGNSPSAYGFYITYVGSGAGNTNAFRIQSTNSGTPKTLLVSNQDGIVNFPNGLQYNGSTVASQPWVAAQNYLTAVPAGYATETYVTNAVSALVDSAPGTLNTLNELAAALGDDPNFATTITTAIGNKADVIHTHDIGDVNGLQDALDNKAASTHTHVASDITAGTFNGARLPWTDNDTFTGTYPIVWTASNSLYRSSWLQVRGLDDMLLTRGIIADGVISATGGNSTNWNTAYSWGNHAGLYAAASHNHDSSYVKLDGSSVISNTLKISSGEMGGTYRSWMTQGVLVGGGGSDGAYFGMKVNGSNDAQTVIAWGDDSGDNLHFINTMSGGAADGVTYMTLFGNQNTIRMYKQLDVQETIYATGGNSTEWNTAYGWGNHATAGYGSAGDTAKGVEAFGWGDHAAAGYLTSVTNISGNAGTATKLATARTISLSGDVSGSATFDGSVNATISVTVADNSHNHTTLSALGDYVWNNADNGRTFPRGIQTSFVSASQSYPSFGSVMRIATYSGINDGGTAELYFPYSTTYGGDTIKYKLGQYNNAGWSQWYNVASREWVTAQNYLTSLPAHTHTFASLTSKPTTLSGYGITDAATSGQGTKADTAYGWGDHSQQQYITQVQGDTLYQPIGNYAADVHTHPYLPLVGGTLSGDLRFNQGSGYGRIAYVDNYHGMVLRGYPNNATASITVGDVTSLIQHSGDFRFYRTNGSINELYFQVNSTAAYHRGNQIWDTSDFSSTNVSNWNTAYGWGNHASAGYATPADITTAINNLVDSAPGALNTLNELAAAIGDDANFATTITNSIATKAKYQGSRFQADLNTLGISAASSGIYSIGAGYTNGPGANLYGTLYSFWNEDISVQIWPTYNGDFYWRKSVGASFTGSTWRTIWDTSHFSSTNVSNWNTAYGWGNHATAGYGSAGDTAKGVEAFGWGNHADAGYITDGNTNWDNTYGFITASASITGNAATASMLTGSYSIGAQPGTSKLLYTGQISAGTTGLFATTDNSNSIITLNRHSGNYDSQLGFSSNGNIYYRKFSNSNAFLTQPWLQVWHSGNFADNSSNWNTAYGWGNHAVAGYATQAWVTAQGFASATGNATQAWVTANYQPLGSYAASTHQHDASAIVSGQFATELIPDLSGTYSLSSHSHTFASITSKPTTLSGYGITDAASSSHTHPYLPLSGGTMTGVITTPNGTHGIIVGDDSRLADRNVANTLFVEGNQTNNAGYINFGQTTGAQLGISAAGAALTWKGNTVWHAGNDGTGSGLDADTLDGLQASEFGSAGDTAKGVEAFGWGNHAGLYAAASHTHSYLPLSGGTITGNLTLNSTLISNSSQTRDKLRVWTSGSYTIGMKAGYTFGPLQNNYAMSFQMNNDSARGFWWGDDAHTDAQGAMALTTDGKLTVATSLRLGFGESDTTDSPASMLEVNGDIVGQNINPASDRAYTLGADDRRWQIVFCETLDSAGLHEANLASDTTGFHATGTVLVWKNGEAVPCTEFADYMKIGIAVFGNASPLVQGAEPVLCTGKVNEGDYLVTSQTEGHAIAMSRIEVKKQDIMDCVIGKALESGDGDSHLIKTWVNI
jgi:hypothetical protein